VPTNLLRFSLKIWFIFCKAIELFRCKMHFHSNVLRYMFGEDDKARLRPNRSPHPHPFYSSSSSPRPPGPCRRVASAIIHHPVLFGTSDKFRECWCNYIKHKSVITSLCDRNEECTIDARACLSAFRVPVHVYCVKLETCEKT